MCMNKIGGPPHLGVADNTDEFTVFLHLVKVFFDARFASFVLPATRRFGEGLLLGAVPLISVDRACVGERKRTSETHQQSESMSGVSELPQE